MEKRIDERKRLKKKRQLLQRDIEVGKFDIQITQREDKSFQFEGMTMEFEINSQKDNMVKPSSSFNPESCIF